MNKISGDGYHKIYSDLLQELRQADIDAFAKALELARSTSGEVEIPFLGRNYLLSNEGVTRADGHSFPNVTGSGLIRYLLTGSNTLPSGEFVTLAALAGPLFSQGGYSDSALELPIKRCFQGRSSELLCKAESLGGRLAGEGGIGSISLVFDLLPHIEIQLVFYDKDEEFPARAALLFDKNATKILDFETLAVLTTVFVSELTKTEEPLKS